MKNVRIYLLAFSITGMMTQTAGAEPTLQMPDPGNWRGSITAGLDTDINSDLIDSERVQYKNQSGTVYNISTDKNTFNDVYGSTLTGGFEAAYAVTRFSEIFGRASYSTASGDTVNFGKLGSTTVTASFDDYTAYGVDLGYRYFFDLENTGFTPYLGGVAGMRYIPGFGASLSATGSDLGSVNLFDDSFVPNFGFDIGFLYPLSRNFAVGFETGLYYMMKLKDDDSSFVGSGLDANDSADRLYVPARLKGTLKF